MLDTDLFMLWLHCWMMLVSVYYLRMICDLETIHGNSPSNAPQQSLFTGEDFDCWVFSLTKSCVSHELIAKNVDKCAFV